MRTFKRGQTFSWAGTVKNGADPLPLGDWQVAADLRSAIGFSLVQHLSVTVLDAATGKIRLSALPAETVKWPVSEVYLDIKMTDAGGNVVSSPTQCFAVIERVTQ
ncbi:hypothetical protein [Caballeronia sp. LZ034LL]|uniref:hypothetical protein n=1 Tax=Caballeronia sp. LZ034LL TaxID=3038567 RepID=UPI00285663DB|nr:hypothetical protein [Caballeronia sp. LZ034LL]MDR5839329.1 hypothetical protein [Caballeronia sp. LZ034LL]